MKDTNYTIQTSKDNYVTYTTSGNKKMNNYEKIKNMSIEEMAEFLAIMQVNAIKQIIVPNEEEQINRYKNSLIKARNDE